jgi:hypothetical protein
LVRLKEEKLNISIFHIDKMNQPPSKTFGFNNL